MCAVTDCLKPSNLPLYSGPPYPREVRFLFLSVTLPRGIEGHGSE